MDISIDMYIIEVLKLTTTKRESKMTNQPKTYTTAQKLKALTTTDLTQFIKISQFKLMLTCRKCKVATSANLTTINNLFFWAVKSNNKINS